MIREETDIVQTSTSYSTSQLLQVVGNLNLYSNGCNNSNSSTTNSTADDMSDTGSLIFDEDPTDLVSLTQDELILKKERIRQQTVSELVKTEANYVRDLKLITKLYIDPIRGHIDLRQYHEVFGCTEGLLNYHREMIHCLEGIPNKPPHLQNVGETLFRFFESMDYLNLYKEFCSNQNTCSDSFEKLKSSSKVFLNCIEGASKSHLTRGLSFPMLIIKPIQRITKYPLLLKSLLENTPYDHMDYRYINFCYLKINSILEEVNQQKRLSDEKIENDKKLKEIEQSLQHLEDLKLVNSTRRFIKEGLVAKKLDKELLRCILFNDILILSKNKKSNSTVKLIIYLENILIRDSIDSLPGYKEGFELLVLNEKKEKIIGLYFSSEAEKKEWLAAIQSLSGGNIDQHKQNKYSWFLKKNSGSFLSTSSLSSFSNASTPTLSIDISMSPSPRSSTQLTLGIINNGGSNGNSGGVSSSNSPNLESPSFNKLSSSGTAGRSQNQTPPTTISLNSTTPNSGSLRESRKPPPPPNVKDIFNSGGACGKINGGGPYSAGPSPNGTLTYSTIDAISPTFQSTVPSSSNFSRASSVPSFYNLQNGGNSNESSENGTRHNARRMPQTISSIPISEDTQQHKLNIRPTPPPRNPSPYNTITSADDYNHNSIPPPPPSIEHPLSAPTSGFNTPLSSSCDYIPIKNGSGSKSSNGLLFMSPPPPLLVPTPQKLNNSNNNSGGSLPPPPPIKFTDLPPPQIDYHNLPPPPPPSNDNDNDDHTITPPPPPTIVKNTTTQSKLPPPPIDSFDLPPPPPLNDNDGFIPIQNNRLKNNATPPLPPKNFGPTQLPPPPQTTPPSTIIRAKSPVNKPIIVPRAKSPSTVLNNSQPSIPIQNPNSSNSSNNNQSCKILPINPNSAFKKANSEMSLSQSPATTAPFTILKNNNLPTTTRSSSSINIIGSNLPPPPPLDTLTLPLSIPQNPPPTKVNNGPILPPPPHNYIISNNINNNCNLINKNQTAFKPLTKSTGVIAIGRKTPPPPLSLPNTITTTTNNNAINYNNLPPPPL